MRPLNVTFICFPKLIFRSLVSSVTVLMFVNFPLHFLYSALQRHYAVCTNNDPLIGVIDQGTSSSRFIVFSTRDGSIISRHQVPVQRQYPHSGWVQICADDIYGTVLKCINHVASDLQARHIPPKVMSRLLTLLCL